MIKPNWDVVVDKCYGRISVGFIALNFKSEVVAAQCFTENILVKPIVGEALAALYAVKLEQEINFIDLILEGSALQIVNAVNAESKNWTKFGHIVRWNQRRNASFPFVDNRSCKMGCQFRCPLFGS
jgi:hypothetical protein